MAINPLVRPLEKNAPTAVAMRVGSREVPSKYGRKSIVNASPVGMPEVAAAIIKFRTVLTTAKTRMRTRAVFQRFFTTLGFSTLGESSVVDAGGVYGVSGVGSELMLSSFQIGIFLIWYFQSDVPTYPIQPTQRSQARAITHPSSVNPRTASRLHRRSSGQQKPLWRVELAWCQRG